MLHASGQRSRGRSGERRVLEDGAQVAVLGGGPAGAFFALHLLHLARLAGRNVTVTLFERRRAPESHGPVFGLECWRGCNYCAGGISPRLNDALGELGIGLPETVIQSRIRSLTIQGFWKNIELEVPPGREMLSVFRGSRPDKRLDRISNFDSFLLEQALKEGAALMSSEVRAVRRLPTGQLSVEHVLAGRSGEFLADFVVFATGINEQAGAVQHSPMLQALRELVPGFVPPRVRHALIFEVEVKPALPAALADSVYFVEYGSRKLRLEMCSLVPKHDYITVVLVGPSVDRLSQGECHHVITDFLNLPHIRKLLPGRVCLHAACACRPSLVLESARHPYTDRVAAAGDLVTSRLYKDGILSAYTTARALAETITRCGIDARSLREGYEPVLRRFRTDNRVAALVFVVHRVFFSSAILSRILYQAVITERKQIPSSDRHLEKILWRIASGDDQYRDIFRSMLHPLTLWAVLVGGSLVTLRNYLTELFFGLSWEGVGGFTTGVALERLEEKRTQFSRLMADASVSVPQRLEFERMYTIKIAGSRAAILEQLGRFGEPDRSYLRPRWVTIRRIAGQPNQPGCEIQYELGSPRLAFSLVLEQVAGGHLAVYRVRNGFARGGVLVFEIEPLNAETCALSIYVAFNFTRGETWAAKAFWWGFRLLFPAFMHDVLWNHSLCQLKDLVELHAGSPVAAAAGPIPALAAS